ncbi:MAG: DUF3179 domain-containing protein, partial [Dehalococcoidia bacterium]
MRRRKWLALAAAVAIVGAACGSAAANGGSDTSNTPTPTSIPTPAPTATPAPPQTGTPTPTETPSDVTEPSFTPGPEPDYDPRIRFRDVFGWRTDFSKHSIDYNDILVAQVRDGIPSIDEPTFLPADPSPFWLGDLEPVILIEVNGEARAYPIQVLIWHEVVNDVVGGVPVLVTFCPLCNTAIAFERTVNGTVHDFGTSGMLRFSDLIMYDRQTETWWQQIGGEAIVGDLTGTRLKQVPASIVSWEVFRASFPSGQVLSRDTGFSRDYGRNPYPGYDNINQSPFLFTGPEDNRLRAMERVTTVDIGDEAVAYPFLELEKVPVVNDTVGGMPIVVFFTKGTVSGLDSSIIGASRDIGAGLVYSRVVDGMELTFVAQGDGFVDNETGTTWNILGQAVGGEMAGKTLEPVLHANHFWFAWAAFKPET